MFCRHLSRVDWRTDDTVHVFGISYCTLFTSEEAEAVWAETSSLSQINTYCFRALGPHGSDPSQVYSHWNFVYMYICKWICVCVCVCPNTAENTAPRVFGWRNNAEWWDGQRNRRNAEVSHDMKVKTNRKKKYTTLWCSRQLLHTETNKGLHFKITSCPRKSHIAVPNYFSAQTSLRASWAPLIQLKAALFNLHGNNRSNDDSRILDAACSEKKSAGECSKGHKSHISIRTLLKMYYLWVFILWSQ